jgi:exosortase A-associated hydrolase 1
MSYREEAIAFDCAGETLIGILSMPAPTASSSNLTSDVGVVIIVGGPQYRTGSHRQFTLLARALARAGFAALRFDYRGMGDSTGVARDFESVNADIGAAIDQLARSLPTVERVVLWGLCDGASAALLYLHTTRDARVAGLALANPWVRNEASLARTRVKHYYLRRLRQPEFWRKALSGHVAGKAAVELWRNVGRSFERSSAKHSVDASSTPPQAPFQQRMAEAALDFDGKLLLLVSGNDLTAHEFLEHVQHEARWWAALRRDDATRCDFARADHTFSTGEDMRVLEQSTVRFLVGLGTAHTCPAE